MGIWKKWNEAHQRAVANAPIERFGSLTDSINIYATEIERMGGDDAGRHSLEGVTARVEDGAALEKRVTATRLLAFGVFAFAAKKKKGGESFLTIEGPDFFWAIEVDRKKKGDAMKFAAKVNHQVKQAAASNG